MTTLKKNLARLLAAALTLMMLLAYAPVRAEAAASSGKFGSGLTWSYVSGKLTISGTGTMPDFKWDEKNAQYDVPWKNWNAKIKTIVVKDGVKNIGAHAFPDCENATKIVIGNSATKIGDGALACAPKGIPDSNIK